MSTPISIQQIAAALTGGPPLAHRQQEDGSLVVVAHSGQKFHFSCDQVAAKRRELEPKPKTAAAKKSPSRPEKSAAAQKLAAADARKTAPARPARPTDQAQ